MRQESRPPAQRPAYGQWVRAISATPAHRQAAIAAGVPHPVSVGCHSPGNDLNALDDSGHRAQETAVEEIRHQARAYVELGTDGLFAAPARRWLRCSASEPWRANVGRSWIVDDLSVDQDVVRPAFRSPIDQQDIPRHPLQSRTADPCPRAWRAKGKPARSPRPEPTIRRFAVRAASARWPIAERSPCLPFVAKRIDDPPQAPPMLVADRGNLPSSNAHRPLEHRAGIIDDQRVAARCATDRLGAEAPMSGDASVTQNTASPTASPRRCRRPLRRDAAQSHRTPLRRSRPRRSLDRPRAQAGCRSRLLIICSATPNTGWGCTRPDVAPSGAAARCLAQP